MAWRRIGDKPLSEPMLTPMYAARAGEGGGISSRHSPTAAGFHLVIFLYIKYLRLCKNYEHFRNECTCDMYERPIGNYPGFTDISNYLKISNIYIFFII